MSDAIVVYVRLPQEKEEEKEQEIEEEESFATFEEVEAKVIDLLNKYHPLRVLKSVSIENYNHKVMDPRRRLPVSLKYSQVTYGCKHYGAHRTRSKGLRVHKKVLPKGCKYFIQFTFCKNKNRFIITKQHLEHNHEIGPELVTTMKGKRKGRPHRSSHILRIIRGENAEVKDIVASDIDANNEITIDSNNHQIMLDPNMESIIQPYQSGKREGYLEWPDYFMAVAFLSAQRSKDPNTQVGACIVDPENRIVGIGYNGMPNGCDDDLLPWAREADDPLDTKYLYVCHAEMNAILNKNSTCVRGCTIYVALFPCNECAKLIIQAGIVRIVYMSDKYHNEPKSVASRRLLDMAGVEIIQHIPKDSHIVINFNKI